MSAFPRSRQEHALALLRGLLDDLDAEKARTSTALQRLKRVTSLLSDPKLSAWIQAEENGYPISVATYSEAERAIAESLRADNPSKKMVARITKEVYRPLPDHRVAWFSGEYGDPGARVALGGPLGEYEALLDAVKKQPKTTFTFEHEGRKLVWSGVRLQRLVEGVRGQIYDEATRLQELLFFGQIPAHAIEHTFSFVDAELFRMLPSTAERLTAAYQNLAERREENWINVADTCRRVIKDFADKVFPSSNVQSHGLAVTEDKYLNRIRAFIKEKIQSRRQAQQLDTVLLLLAELLSRTDNLASRTLHEGSASRYEAERILLYTYLAIGDVLVLSGLSGRPDAARERVKLSSASIEDLTEKVGLKLAIAESIVKARRGKVFRSWDDIAAIPGVGAKTLARLQENAAL